MISLDLNLRAPKAQFQKVNYNNTKNYNLQLSQTPRDSVSFTGMIVDPLSPPRCFIALQKASITTAKDLEKNVKEENLIARGIDADTYKFNDSSLDGWVLKVEKTPFTVSSDSLHPVADEFYPLNMGQAVIEAGDRYRICKKVEGKPHSVKDWRKHIENGGSVSRSEAVEFYRNLKRIAAFPQTSFDSYARQVSALGEVDYKQDSINPNNIIVDYKKQKISTIDAFKANKPSHINSRMDLSMALVDFTLFPNYYSKLNSSRQKGLIKAAQTVVDKCNTAARRKGVSPDENTYRQFLADVDKRFGSEIEDSLGGNFTYRYEVTKGLLGLG